MVVGVESHKWSKIEKYFPDYMSLKTIKDIKRGEELTVKYTLYKIKEVERWR